MATVPDYIFCVECQTPCYAFEWDEKKGRLDSAYCQACGNDDIEAFSIQDPSDADSDE